MNPNHQIATLAGGCFWCLEAVFDELNGVVSVESGYAGGRIDNPSPRVSRLNGDDAVQLVEDRFETPEAYASPR